MDELMSFIESMSGIFENPYHLQVGFAFLIGLAIFLLVIALVLVVAGIFDPLRQRLRYLESSVSGATQGSGESNLNQWLSPMAEKLVPEQGKSLSDIAQKLRHAGKRSSSAVKLFYGVRLLMTVVPSVLLMALLPLMRMPLEVGIMLVACLSVIGYLLPRLWLELSVKRRTTLLSRGLPDALDLLVVCSESGLGLVAAIQRVSRDLEISHPELADEFHIFCMQTRAGMDNRSALRDLEYRNGVEDIRGLVTSLVQSMRFGTSIASTLRIFAMEMRDKRTQEAEEKAAKISTKMLFPLIFCILPSFLLVTLGPPILSVVKAFANM